MPSQRFLWKLALVSTAIIAPLYAYLLFRWPHSTDYIFYATAAKLFSAEFWRGDLYPRWLTDINAGLGAPVFLFYAPLPYYVASLFAWLAPFDPHGFGRVIASMGVAIFVSGITGYRWLRFYASDAEAQKFALIYAGFPYLFFIVYNMVSPAQMWAVALFPFLLEAAARLAEKGWRGLPQLSLGYALLAFTHLPSLIVFGWIPLLYVAVFSARHIGAALLAALLGALLAAIYLLPAAMDKIYIASAHFTDRHFFYADNFMNILTAIAFALTIVPLIGFYIDMPKASRVRCLTPQARFWLIVLAALAFMTLPISKPIWEALPLLHYLQFPFRFCLAMVPGTVMVFMLWQPYLKNPNFYFYTSALVGASLIGSSYYLEYSPPSATNVSFMESNFIPAIEYNTVWQEAAGYINPRRDLQPYTNATPELRYAWGEGTAVPFLRASRRIAMHVHVKSPTATLVLRRFYFPGWQINIGEVVETKALLGVTLPRGTYDVILSLPWFPGEREGMMISGAALLLWMGLYAASRRSITAA